MPTIIGSCHPQPDDKLLLVKIQMKIKNCSDCGKPFTCSEGESQENKKCWCNDFPPIMPLDFKKDCRCPACLNKIVKEKIEAFVKTITPENAVNCLPKNYTGNGKLVEGIDYEIEGGKWVFSKWYHLKRGHCCHNGCVNCPYTIKEKTK